MRGGTCDSRRKKGGFGQSGCAKNLVDAEVMLGKLYEQGYELTLDPTQADYLIVNTCGFIQSAKEESIDHILEMAQIKAQGKQKKLVVTGCLAQRYGDELLQEMPEIDVLVGTGDFQHLPAGFRCSCSHRYRSVPISAMTSICIRKTTPVSRPRRGTQRISKS